MLTKSVICVINRVTYKNITGNYNFGRMRRMKKTVAIFGGDKESTYKQLGKKNGCDVLFHNGKARNGGTVKAFQPLVNKADFCIVLLGSIGHISQDLIKELGKELGKPVIFQPGKGVSAALRKGLDLVEAV